MSLALTRAGETSRAYPYGNRVHHQGSLREAEVDKERNQRKRISVAVRDAPNACYNVADVDGTVLALPQEED